MKNKNRKLIFPQKEDYPKKFRLLDEKRESTIYYQLVESSASAYFETNWLTRFIFYQRFSKALDLIPKSKDYNEILDAGSGIGFFLPSLVNLGKNIWAIDFAEHSISYARHMAKIRRLKKVSFLRVNLEKEIPIKRKFDLIVCLSVLEHIRDLDRAFKNLKSKLKKDGILIAGYPNEDNIVFRFFQFLEKRLMRPTVYKTLGGTKLIHFSRASKINRIIKKYFLVDKTINMNLLPFCSFYIIKRCKNKE